MAPLMNNVEIAQHLSQTRQPVGGGRIDEQAVGFELLDEEAIRVRTFFAHPEFTCQKITVHIQHQILAGILPADGEGFPIEDNEAGTPATMREHNVLQGSVQSAQRRNVTDLLAVSDTTKRTAIFQVHVWQR